MGTDRSLATTAQAIPPCEWLGEIAKRPIPLSHDAYAWGNEQNGLAGPATPGNTVTYGSC